MATPKSRIPICHPGGEVNGLFFPMSQDEQTWDERLRAVLYGVAMLYLFLGVNIVADKFMSAIEMIRSRKLRVRVRETGKMVTVTFWNPTVANLTLMALGSSAPEIMLSIVEVIRNRFYQGELGPSTILGSAAFNLFVIVGVCILTIPSTEVRRIKEMGVFMVTLVFSIFSYLWMLFIVQVNSPDVIELWEAGATLALFPVLIFISYLADIGWLSNGRPALEVIDTGRAPTIVTYTDDPADKYDDNVVIRDQDGIPVKNSAGVLTFDSDAMDIHQGQEERQVMIPVHRRNGTQGTVACTYSMEPLTAMPDYDYRHAEGELRFGPGQARADIPLGLLPKRPGERADRFQVILSDPEGGVLFNPHFDGARSDRCLLTVTIKNEAEDEEQSTTIAQRAAGLMDGTVNLDRLRLGSVTWYEDIMDAIFNVSGEDTEGVSMGDWILHIVSFPWKLMYALLVPPPIYCGGWVCFTFALLHIAGLTAIVIDFAELFGCVCNIENFITAITFVALGTSMPDLFASITAAVQDEWADASIINVTGSNSVNVFLGIGLPWTLCSVYWAIVGATPDWQLEYSQYLNDWPGGAFIVRGDNLTFSVGVFSIAACICLSVILLRRMKFGGELGGPFGWKVTSFLLLVLLWFFYIGLSVWKSWSQSDLGGQVLAICIGLCILENALLILGFSFYGCWSWSRRNAGDKKGPNDIEDLPAEDPKAAAPPKRPLGPRDPQPLPPATLMLPTEMCFQHP